MHYILEEWELKGEKGERGRMRKTWGFAQNKLRKTKIFVSCATFAKNISGFAQIAQKNSAKVRKKKICAKIFAQKI